ncbi:MAG: T9SS type A sorting domain-containing protein, partial [Haliscomenobacter sp.]
VVRGKEALPIIRALSVDSRITKAEAYDQVGSPLAVQLISGEEGVPRSAVLLYQNQPNPFSGETSIGFYLPAAEDVALVIQDMTGRTVYQVEGHFGAGNHQVSIKSDRLKGAGVYYYTLRAGDFSATRKMIRME